MGRRYLCDAAREPGRVRDADAVPGRGPGRVGTDAGSAVVVREGEGLLEEAILGIGLPRAAFLVCLPTAVTSTMCLVSQSVQLPHMEYA